MRKPVFGCDKTFAFIGDNMLFFTEKLQLLNRSAMDFLIVLAPKWFLENSSYKQRRAYFSLIVLLLDSQG